MRFIVSIFLFLAFTFGAPQGRADEADRSAPTNIDTAGVAIGGYDPVAYFEIGGKALGSPDFTAKHEGATYHFANAEHRDLFRADPARYAPQFGGYCAYGVRVGRKFDIDPDAFQIVDNRLFLLLNPGTQMVWRINRSENIDIADRIWPVIRAKSDIELAKKAEKRGG